MAAVGLATVAAGVLSRGNPVLTAAPVAAVTVGFALLRYPLRWAVGLLFFLLLALEVTGDAAGIWNTPLIVAGDLLSDVSGAITHVKLAGFEALAVVLLGDPGLPPGLRLPDRRRGAGPGRQRDARRSWCSTCSASSTPRRSAS